MSAKIKKDYNTGYRSMIDSIDGSGLRRRVFDIAFNQSRIGAPYRVLARMMQEVSTDV